MSLFGLHPPPELRRMLWIWLLVSAITTPLIVVFVGPALPPGAASDAAHGQQQDNTVMLAIVWPIIAGLLMYFGYTLRTFRRSAAADPLEDGPPIRGDNRVIALWLATTLVIVVFLAAWGAYELFPGEVGAGGGEGATPLSVSVPADASSALPVQVIGQQWAWTFRYPTYGGLETTTLELPVDRLIRFDVTSIDVVHSFWAVALAVKADANPGIDNVAWAKPVMTGTSAVRCAELCGLWHGHMVTSVSVVPMASFQQWIAQQRRAQAPITRYLPPYAPTYAPSPSYRST